MKHDFVEIGGVKWATMNIGASSVNDYGLYFQWGDIKGYTQEQVGMENNQKYFDWGDYKFKPNVINPYYDVFTKYNTTDGLKALEPFDDAAHMTWLGGWRIPTTEEFQKLIVVSVNSWVTDYQDSGINGTLFTDKTDSSKVLFFPAAGYCGQGFVYDVGSYYWSSSLSIGVSCGYSLCFNRGFVGMLGVTRYYGFPVRAVLDEE